MMSATVSKTIFFNYIKGWYGWKKSIEGGGSMPKALKNSRWSWKKKWQLLEKISVLDNVNHVDLSVWDCVSGLFGTKSNLLAFSPWWITHNSYSLNGWCSFQFKYFGGKHSENSPFLYSQRVSECSENLRDWIRMFSTSFQPSNISPNGSVASQPIQLRSGPLVIWWAQ